MSHSQDVTNEIHLVVFIASYGFLFQTGCAEYIKPLTWLLWPTSHDHSFSCLANLGIQLHRLFWAYHYTTL